MKIYHYSCVSHVQYRKSIVYSVKRCFSKNTHYKRKKIIYFLIIRKDANLNVHLAHIVIVLSTELPNISLTDN